MFFGRCPLLKLMLRRLFLSPSSESDMELGGGGFQSDILNKAYPPVLLRVVLDRHSQTVTFSM
jgi:hypothetical protein